MFRNTTTRTPLMDTARSDFFAGDDGKLRSTVIALANTVLVHSLERRAGIEPANTGFADLRVSHFATGAC